MATHSSVLAWRIPGMAELGGLPSLGSHRVGHDWSDLAAAAAAVILGWGGHTHTHTHTTPYTHTYKHITHCTQRFQTTHIPYTYTANHICTTDTHHTHTTHTHPPLTYAPHTPQTILTTHTPHSLCTPTPHFARQKGNTVSLITPPLLEKNLNYDIVTWGLANRLLQVSSTWRKSKASFLPSFFWILECRQQIFPSVNECV